MDLCKEINSTGNCNCVSKYLGYFLLFKSLSKVHCLNKNNNNIVWGLFKKSLPNTIQPYTHMHEHSKIYHNQVGFVPGMWSCVYILKSININHHINKQKEKNPIITLKDTENAFDKILYPILTKL
jgi:hypothetical protein